MHVYPYLTNTLILFVNVRFLQIYCFAAYYHLNLLKNQHLSIITAKQKQNNQRKQLPTPVSTHRKSRHFEGLCVDHRVADVVMGDTGDIKSNQIK